MGRAVKIEEAIEYLKKVYGDKEVYVAHTEDHETTTISVKPIKTANFTWW